MNGNDALIEMQQEINGFMADTKIEELEQSLWDMLMHTMESGAGIEQLKDAAHTYRSTVHLMWQLNCLLKN